MHPDVLADFPHFEIFIMLLTTNKILIPRHCFMFSLGMRTGYIGKLISSNNSKRGILLNDRVIWLRN